MEEPRPQEPLAASSSPPLPPGPPPPYDYSTPGPRRLTRSRSNRVIGGVCAGLARYLNVDPTFVRIAFVILALVPPSIGFIAYLIGWIAIPEESEAEAAIPIPSSDTSERPRMIAGAVLIAIGAILLIRIVVPWFDERFVWALILIGAGLVLVLRGTNR
jgi:phage shock protein C